MNIEAVLGVSVAVAALAVIVTWQVARRRIESLETELQEQVQQARVLEQKLHLERRDELEELNRQQLKHHEDLRSARALALEEGRAVGHAERKSDHITEINVLRSQHSEELARAREQAAAEARDQLRAEYELRLKLFDVKILPYVETGDVDSFFSREEDVRMGYQYQLFVNGVPAFQPHVVIEKTERRKKSKDENIEKFVAIATDLAGAAAQLYLGAGAKLATIGGVVVNRVGQARKLLPKLPGSGVVVKTE